MCKTNATILGMSIVYIYTYYIGTTQYTRSTENMLI